jgi:hypothetical protein
MVCFEVLLGFLSEPEERRQFEEANSHFGRHTILSKSKDIHQKKPIPILEDSFHFESEDVPFGTRKDVSLEETNSHFGHFIPFESEGCPVGRNQFPLGRFHPFWIGRKREKSLYVSRKEVNFF